MQVELTAEGRIDHVQFDVVDAERFVAQQSVRDVAEPFVGDEVRRLGSHQNGVDNERFAEKSNDHNDEQRQHPTHQVGPQGFQMLKKSHLVIG